MKEPSVVSGWFRNLYTQINRNVQHQSQRNDYLQRSARTYLDVYHSRPDRYVKRPHSVLQCDEAKGHRARMYLGVCTRRTVAVPRPRYLIPHFLCPVRVT